MQTDDETLMALADGEITGAQAERLHRTIAADVALAARYAMFVETAKKVREAVRQDPRAAVSDDLVARIRALGATSAGVGVPQSADIVPFRRAAIPQWQPMALAASLALAVGIGTGMVLDQSPAAPDIPKLGAAVTASLDSTPSGQETVLADGRRLTVVASFMDAAGRFCREYETATPAAGGYVAVACRGAGAWDLRFAMATGAAAEGYAPASSLEALDAFYAATGAGEPLSPEAELAQLK